MKLKKKVPIKNEKKNKTNINLKNKDQIWHKNKMK
jgi:hypothetical protein